MSHDLRFAHLVIYDAGAPGVALDVTLRLGETHVQVAAKLDTGASCSIFQRKHGEQLGIGIEGGMRQEFNTATGNFVTYGHEVTLDVAGIVFNTMVYFAENEALNRDVIGRFGGLDHLRVGIVDYDGELYLSSYDAE